MDGNKSNFPIKNGQIIAKSECGILINTGSHTNWLLGFCHWQKISCPKTCTRENGYNNGATLG